MQICRSIALIVLGSATSIFSSYQPLFFNNYSESHYHTHNYYNDYRPFYNNKYSQRDNYIIKNYRCINEGTLDIDNHLRIDTVSLSGNGTMAAKSVEIWADVFDYNGLITSTGRCDIHAHAFNGNATIIADDIIIVCDDSFNFKGTITCNHKCVIYARKPFDYTQFKKAGNGHFTVVTTKRELYECTKEEIIKSVIAEAVGAYADIDKKLSNKEIDTMLNGSRIQAILGRIDEKEFFASLTEQLQQRLDYHRARLDEHKDPARLKIGAISLGAAALSAAAGYALYKYSDKISQQSPIPELCIASSIGAGVYSGLFAIGGVSSLQEGFKDPQHAKRFDRLSAIIKRIEKAQWPSLSEEIKIVELQ